MRPRRVAEKTPKVLKAMTDIPERAGIIPAAPGICCPFDFLIFDVI